MNQINIYYIHSKKKISKSKQKRDMLPTTYMESLEHIAI